jgi:hypothetical protein
MTIKCKVSKGADMSFPFSGGQNPYQPKGAKDDIFIKPVVEFNFQPKRAAEDITLFDIANEDDLNDTGKKLTSDDIFGGIAPEFDGAKWLGLTGKGTFGDEPMLMETSFLKAPPQKIDKEGNPVKTNKDTGNDWSWNTLV